MSADFEEFARAAGNRSAAPATPPAKAQRVAVLGGGPDGRLWAALTLAAGVDTVLFSAYGKELDLLRASSGIALRGEGPIGTYRVDQGTRSIALTAELDAAVSDADVILLTGPVHKQRTYAMVLADHVRDGQMIIAPRAGTFGAFELSWMLRLGGCTAKLTIVEADGAPYWFETEGASLELTSAGPVSLATLSSDDTGRLSVLDALIPDARINQSALASGFSDLSAAVEAPALIMGGPGLSKGGANVPFGGVALPENNTFHALLGEDQLRLIGLLAEERRSVAAAFGVRNLPETPAWIARYTGEAKGARARPVPENVSAHALLRDGVVNSLVPLASAAAVAGVSVPQTEALIRLSEACIGTDVSTAGRRLGAFGVPTNSLDNAHRFFEAEQKGGA